MASKNKMRNQSRKGTTSVELALALPLLMLMALGGSDFARLFFHAITVAHAANAGSSYGAQSVIHSKDLTKITEAAKEDAYDVGDVTTTPELYCDCPFNTSEVDCITGTCGGSYGSPRVYSKIQVQQTFDTLVDWPGIPSSVNVSHNVYRRVQ